MEKSRDPSALSLDSLRRLTDSLSVDLTTDRPSQSSPAPLLAPTQPPAISPHQPPGKLPIPRLATKYEPIPIAPRLTTMTEPNRGSPPPPPSQRALNDVIMTQPVSIPRTIPTILPKPSSSSPTIRPVMTSSPTIVFRGPPGAPPPISLSGQSGKFKLAPATPQNVALAATCRTALLVPKRMIASLRPPMQSSPATSTTMSQYPKPVQTAQVVMDSRYQQPRPAQQQQRLRAGAVPFSLKSTGEIMTNVAVSRQAVAPGNMGKFTLVPRPSSSIGRPVGVVATMDHNNKPSILRKPGNVKISMTSSASGTHPVRVMTTMGRKPVYVKYDPTPSAHQQQQQQQQSLRHIVTSKRHVTAQSAPHHRVTAQSQVVPRPRVTSQPQPRLTSPQHDHAEILQKLHKHMKAKESVAPAAAVPPPSSSSSRPPPLICTSQPPIAPPRMFYIQKKPSPPPPPPPAPAPPPPTSPLGTHRSKESILRAQRQRMLAESRRKLEQRSAAINRSYAPPPPRAPEARDPVVAMVPIRPRPPQLQRHDATMATRPPPPPRPQPPPRLMMPFHATWRPRPFEMKSSLIYRPKSAPRQHPGLQQQHPGYQKRPFTQEHEIVNSRAFRIVGGKVERPRVVTSSSNVPVVPPTTLSIATSSPSIMMTLKRPKLIPAGSPVKKPVAVVKRGVEEEGDVAMIDETEVARGKISREKLVFMAALGLVTPNKLREIQAKRSLRKRRSSSYSVTAPITISPEPKKKRLDQGYRITSLSELQDRRRQGKRIPESEDGHEDSCAICHGSGQVLMCDSCSRVYHLHCLDPPLRETPPGVWICPQCRKNLAKKGAVKWSGTLMVVRSYLEHKSECEEERKALIEKINQLREDRSRLEERAQTLSSNIMLKIQLRSDLLAEEERMRLSLQKLENVVASFAAINN